MQADELDRAIRQAAEIIAAADALLIGAGAGMGVDSGLPDFRGSEGFWNAYPPFRERGLSFVDLANPVWFESDPAQAWGFYGHRLHLYRDASPHPGFALLRRWAEAKPGGYFVFTSNVDGHFQRAGFDDRRIIECHGSIHHLQCSAPCCDTIWPADDSRIDLMFGDGRWLDGRTSEQAERYDRWLSANRGRRLAIVECGAGKSVPTVRHHCQRSPGTLIRINPHDFQVPAGGISLPIGAREALERIAKLLV